MTTNTTNNPMKFSPRLFFYSAIACLLAFNVSAFAQQSATPAEPIAADAARELPAVEAETSSAMDDGTAVEYSEGDSEDYPTQDDGLSRFERDSGRDMILHFGKDSHLAAGGNATALIAILGSATSEGKVREAVVSVFGNTRVTGPTGDAAVSIFGNTYVDSVVGGDAVAVFGDLELGPHADIDGEVVVVGGTLTRDPAAVVRGGIQEVSFPGNFGRIEWLRPWLKHCLLYARPLAIEPGLGWAWTLAFAFLTLYVLIAVLFASSVEKCVQTLETQPAHSLLASLLTLLLTPVLMILLTVTIVGIALVPFLGIALFCVGLFGKAVVLAALGRRLTSFIGSGPLTDIAFAVLVGGIIVTGLYLVPVVGFIVYKLLGIIGLGVVIYTFILAAKAKRDSRAVPVAASASASTPETPADVATVIAEPAAATNDGEPRAHIGPAAAATAAPASPPATAALPRAGFWIRMAALLIDAIIIGIVFSALHSAEGIFLPALAAYGAIMWKLKGTTIGGILCNLQVVRLDGRELDWGTAIVRALSCFLSLAVAGLGFLWIVFDNERQSWHDKIAGTVVVRAPQGVSLV